MPQKLLLLISGVAMRLSLKVYFIREYPSFLSTWFLMVNLSLRPIYVTRFHSQDLKAMPERKQWVKVKLLILLSVLWAWWVLIGSTASGKLGGFSNLGKWYSINVFYGANWFLPYSGELQIAEVTSRFTNIQQFLDLVNSIGFRLKSKVSSCNLWTFCTDWLFVFNNTGWIEFPFHFVWVYQSCSYC